MMVATAIDATDGWLARRARVKDVLPGFDGRALDDLIDFHTYASLPLLLLWRADVLPGASAWLLLLPLLASAYGFSQVNAKTDDGFFLGFPSYWNIVAFYLFVLRPPAPVVGGADRHLRGADVRADAVPLRDPGRTVCADHEPGSGRVVRVARRDPVWARPILADARRRVAGLPGDVPCIFCHGHGATVAEDVGSPPDGSSRFIASSCDQVVERSALSIRVTSPATQTAKAT